MKAFCSPITTPSNRAPLDAPLSCSAKPVPNRFAHDWHAGCQTGRPTKDPTIAELLKPLGYVAGQFGKNHLGDRNEYMPTVHGFDEFYGNLYHLNAEEEPEDPDCPKSQQFKDTFGPRGLLDCVATDIDDPTVDPRWGRVGKQKIKDTGPLTRKRMESVEEELLQRSLAFIDKSHKSGKPFFLWHNSTRNHVWIRQSEKWKNKSGHGVFADGMMELDYVVGGLLDKLDELGIADNTIVMFSTDNGPEIFTWPQGGNQPFRGEKDLPGKAVSACPVSFAGLRNSPKEKSSTTFSLIRTGCQLSWQPQANRMSKRNCLQDIRQVTRSSKCTWTATTKWTC